MNILVFFFFLELSDYIRDVQVCRKEIRVGNLQQKTSITKKAERKIITRLTHAENTNLLTQIKQRVTKKKALINKVNYQSVKVQREKSAW